MGGIIFMVNFSNELNMEARISDKLEAAKATSLERAVTITDAKLDLEEQSWLGYVAGGLFARVKKTKDKRYYIASF